MHVPAARNFTDGRRLRTVALTQCVSGLRDDVLGNSCPPLHYNIMLLKNDEPPQNHYSSQQALKKIKNFAQNFLFSSNYAH